MIRQAEVSDAREFCNVVRTSIIELCELDHRGVESCLAEWLENKTVEYCEVWINDENSNSFVSLVNGKVVGVSHIGHNGHLFLCYILPSVKGSGLGGQLLLVAEDSVKNIGLSELTLESTVTAKGFYEHHGYQCCGATANCLKYAKSIKP